MSASYCNAAWAIDPTGMVYLINEPCTLEFLGHLVSDWWDCAFVFLGSSEPHVLWPDAGATSQQQAMAEFFRSKAIWN